MKVSVGSGDQGRVGSSGPAVATRLDLDQLYAEHAAFIGRVLVRFVGDGPQVDDLLQETFIVAWRRWDSFDGRAAPRTWLYAIAANLARRHRRGASRFLRAIGLYSTEPPRDAPRPDDDADRQHARRTVHAALDSLPFKQREVFVLYELEELEGTAIAELLGLPVNTVWTRLHHARTRFREVIAKQPKDSR
jgi:RNA polymerase sigma-70 factor (ECF subfamily)